MGDYRDAEPAAGGDCGDDHRSWWKGQRKREQKNQLRPRGRGGGQQTGEGEEARRARRERGGVSRDDGVARRPPIRESVPSRRATACDRGRAASLAAETTGRRRLA